MTPMVEQIKQAILDEIITQDVHLAIGEELDFVAIAEAALTPIIKLGLQSGSLEVLSFVKQLRKGSNL